MEIARMGQSWYSSIVKPHQRRVNTEVISFPNGDLVPNNSRFDRLTKKRKPMVLDDKITESDLMTETPDEQEDSISDSKSVVTGSLPRSSSFFGDNTARLDEDDKFHNFLKRVFLSSMGSLGKRTTVAAIHRLSRSSFPAKARKEIFKIYSEAMAKKSGGNGNMKFAWYGASKDGIRGIVAHGFGQCEGPQNGGLFGHGIYLSPANFSMDSVTSSVIGEDGLKHLLLCRVILGSLEEVSPGSKQFHPSSEEFDSGVDNLSAPKMYIVWSTRMNTHILPEYVLSFRLDSCPNGFPRVQEPMRKPCSPWMPFPKLMTFLSEFLPTSDINLIKKHYNCYLKKMITWECMIQRVRQIAGDKLLASAIRAYRTKMSKADFI